MHEPGETDGYDTALQQATVAIRARRPLAVLEDVIQPFLTFSEAFLYALQELGAKRLAAV